MRRIVLVLLLNLGLATAATAQFTNTPFDPDTWHDTFDNTPFDPDTWVETANDLTNPAGTA